MTDAITQFRAAMVAAGLTLPASIEPGKFHRFAGINQPNGDDAGWCKLFPDGLGGVFGDWRPGLFQTWQSAKREKPLTPEERKAFRRRCEAERNKREAKERRRQAAAAKKAAKLLAAATGDPASHSYAVKKGAPLGPSVKRGAWPQRGWDDALLIPVYGTDGMVLTVEAINTDGDKDFLRGGRKRGAFHPFGKIRGADRVLIGEGIATVAAAVEATGLPAAAAMDSGNLEHATRALRTLALTAELIFLADNDIKPDGSNPGIEAAARAVGGYVAVPEHARHQKSQAASCRESLR